jgi:xanthine dehydrogenase accessory factor
VNPCRAVVSLQQDPRRIVVVVLPEGSDMNARSFVMQPVAVVVGANAAGSAIAHRLHAAGWAVVLLDDVDPSWTRRGRAYTDAWYLGTAELAGTPAVFCSSVRSIPAALDRGRTIAATTWSAGGVATALKPQAVVDARLADFGVGVRGEVTIRTLADLEAVEDTRRVDFTASPASFVLRAPVSGYFHTHLSIGEAVRSGEPVGTIGSQAIVAGATGRLLGLSARGARVGGGSVIAEIDDRTDRDGCFGLDPGAIGAAESVLACLRELSGLKSGHTPDRIG